MIKHLAPKSKEEIAKIYRKEQFQKYLKNIDGLRLGLYMGLIIVFVVFEIIDSAHTPFGWGFVIGFLGYSIVRELWPKK